MLAQADVTQKQQRTLAFTQAGAACMDNVVQST